jgi:carbon monoxide dehydrogenase subunit G
VLLAAPGGTSRRPMRIEGTYTLPATIDRVFMVLQNPDVLQRTIPGCERLIQLGPATGEGDVAFEIRVKSENAGPATLTVKTTRLRRPDHLQLELHGYAAGGPISGQALVDLVEQGNHTVGAYVLELTAPGLNQGTVQRVISGLYESLADHLYHEGLQRDLAESLLQAEPGKQPPISQLEARTVHYQTPRGQLVALADRWSTGYQLSAKATRWRQRALWMGTGILLGVSVFTIAAVLVRWLGDHQETTV